MKKIIALLFTLIITLALFSCADNGDGQNENGQNEENGGNSSQTPSPGENEGGAQEPDGEEGQEEENEQGAPTISELRASKVFFNIRKDRSNTREDAELIGAMGVNEREDACIEYAPDAYQLFMLISLQDENDGMIPELSYYLMRFDNGNYGTIDYFQVSSKTYMISFSSFFVYERAQEILLDALCQKSNVTRVEVGYINPMTENNGEISEFGDYEFIELEDKIFTENKLYVTYNAFSHELGYSRFNEYEQLQQITEETFEDYYVFLVNASTEDAYGFEFARVRNDKIYLTFNTNRITASKATYAVLVSKEMLSRTAIIDYESPSGDIIVEDFDVLEGAPSYDSEFEEYIDDLDIIVFEAQVYE